MMQFYSCAKSTCVAIATTVLLSSCNFAPDYHRPELSSPTPEAYKESKDWKPATPADYTPRGNWWEVFGSPELNALEAKATQNNQDLKAAFARFEQAKTLVTVARSGYLPNVQATVGATRESDSKRVANSAPITTYNDYLLEGTFSYEIDFWGRIRNGVTAAKATEAASKADYATAYLGIQAELASDYFALRADDASQTILDDTVVDYQKALDLTKSRFKGGVASQTDVDQAEVQVQNARTQAADLHLNRTQLEHAIAVLVGEQPSSFSIAKGPFDMKIPSINTGLPFELLERRPDVASAERQAAAANARIGIARAAWFPTISLAGGYGAESASTGSLLSGPAQLWTLGPSALLTVFDAGRIAALSKEARFAYDEQAANYRSVVLNAYRDVEDSLIAIRQLNQEFVTQSDATNAAERVLTQEQDRYTGGIVNYLDVVIAQNTELQAKLAYINIETRELTASVQLIRALGGGWQLDPKDAPPSDKPADKPKDTSMDIAPKNDRMK